MIDYQELQLLVKIIVYQDQYHEGDLLKILLFLILIQVCFLTYVVYKFWYNKNKFIDF